MKRQLQSGGLLWVFLVILFLTHSQSIHAQEFPSKPISLILPFGPGGSTDLTARAFVGVANEYFGQPVIVQPKPGAGGAIASDNVAKASPDGYTLLMGGPGPNSTLPAIEGRSRGPDDLAAVCRINYNSHLVLVPADAPYRTFQQLVQYAKANPGKLRFGNTGIWGAADLLWKEIQLKAGISTKIIPYDDGTQTLIGLLGGHIDVMSTFPTNSAPQIKAGKIRPLAFADSKRDPDFPEVPTLRELGVDVEMIVWKGILAPKATPRPIIDKLAQGFKKMLEDKSSIGMIQNLGDNFHYLGPDEFTKFWRGEYEAHKEMGKVFKKPN